MTDTFFYISASHIVIDIHCSTTDVCNRQIVSKTLSVVILLWKIAYHVKRFVTRVIRGNLLNVMTIAQVSYK